MIPRPIRARQPHREAWSMERLLTERSISLGLALDRSTSRAYASALNSYLEFCSLHSLDPEPTPDTLSFYITFMSHHIQPRSVRAYLSGIVSHLEAFYPNVKQNRETRLVTRTLALTSSPFQRACLAPSPLMTSSFYLSFLLAFLLSSASGSSSYLTILTSVTRSRFPFDITPRLLPWATRSDSFYHATNPTPALKVMLSLCSAPPFLPIPSIFFRVTFQLGTSFSPFPPTCGFAEMVHPRLVRGLSLVFTLFSPLPFLVTPCVLAVLPLSQPLALRPHKFKL